MTLLIAAFFALWLLGWLMGVNSESHRPGGTRDLRRQRNRARDRARAVRTERDRAYAELRRLNTALMDSGSRAKLSTIPRAMPRDRHATITPLRRDEPRRVTR